MVVGAADKQKRSVLAVDLEQLFSTFLPAGAIQTRTLSPVPTVVARNRATPADSEQFETIEETHVMAKRNQTTEPNQQYRLSHLQHSYVLIKTNFMGRHSCRDDSKAALR